MFLITFFSKYVSYVSGKWLGDESYFVVISDYFYNLSYIFYYLMGAYIHDLKKCNFKKKNVLFVWQFMLIIHTLFYALIGWGKYCNEIPLLTSLWYDNPFLALESILMFVLLYDVKIRNRFITKVFTRISMLSFDMYLISYLFDFIANRKFNNIYWELPSFYISLILIFFF